MTVFEWIIILAGVCMVLALSYAVLNPPDIDDDNGFYKDEHEDGN